MNKKILIILFMMLFITGCSVNYNLEIFGNQIAEKITIKPNGNINVDIDEIASVKQYSYTDLQKKEYYDKLKLVCKVM